VASPVFALFWGAGLAGPEDGGGEVRVVDSTERDGRSSRPVVVVDYDAAWPRRFEELRARLWPVLDLIAFAPIANDTHANLHEPFAVSATLSPFVPCAPASPRSLLTVAPLSSLPLPRAID
jgi:hypothetical protein